MDGHRRFHVYFTPTSGSWLNMAEHFFRNLSEKQLRRGIFKNLDQHNQNPKPFIWTAKGSDILENIARAQAALDKRLSV